MLHRLEIANFYSIREPHVIDLRAAADAPDAAGRLAPLWRGCAELGPRVVALFGANGSGKSNLLTAVSFVAWLLRHSFEAPRGARLPFERFNDAEMAEATTRLAVHLSGPQDIASAGDPEGAVCRYGYECTIGGGARPRIEAETLRYWPSFAGRRGIRLFARDSAGRVSAAAAFGLAGYRPALEKVLRPEASLIATLAQWEHPFARLLSDTADRVLSNVMIDRREASDDNPVRYYSGESSADRAVEPGYRTPGSGHSGDACLARRQWPGGVLHARGSGVGHADDAAKPWHAAVHPAVSADPACAGDRRGGRAG
jgi:hypothetical protein